MATKTKTRVCRRCRGTGHEPARPQYGEQAQALLDRLAELGSERAELQAHRAYMRSEGRRRYDQVLAEIRSGITAAEQLEIQNLDLQDVLGVSSAAFYKIKNGRTGA